MTSPRKTYRALFIGALAFAFALALATASIAGPPAATRPVDKGATEANIARVTTTLLERSQFAHHPLDAQLASKLLDRYLEALDGGRSLFLQSDLVDFAPYRSTLAQATRVEGDTRAAHTIFARYLERLGQQVAFDTELLKGGPFVFTGHDRFSFDREHATRPRDLAAAHALWKQELRAEYLQEKLSDKKKTQEIATTLTRRHAQQLRMMKALGDDEVLEIYLDALTHVYDPHSDYLGKEQMESLSIAMNLSLFGIGASLGSEEGVCTIRDLVPGSPAARGGILKRGDRIIAVAQGTGDPVDITNMPLTRIVELIRGPKGSAVTLTILPPVGAAGASKTVRLIRAEIKLEDQQAKARIVDLPVAPGQMVRLGVIDLSAFYTDGGAGTGSSATTDVARLLVKLKAEQVRGVVLDLRRNGGGSLQEAIALTGLFLRGGPVVQTRDSNNAIEVANDPDPKAVYDGPLMVLISRFSASASEILAGALQDYGRAVIVGDTATFGKGTVQTILPLAGIMDRVGLGHAFDPGALKVTISKFYRPSGASTELRGVAADIVVASTSDVAGVSESKLTDPLPWDTVPTARFQSLNQVAPYLTALRAASAQRLAADAGFSDLGQEIAQLKKRLDGGSVSLNEAERRRELTDNKAFEKAIEAQARAETAIRRDYPLTLKDVSRPGLPPLLVRAPKPSPPTGATAASGDAPAGGADDLDGNSDERSPSDELVFNESLRILGDYVRSQDRPPLPSGHPAIR